MTKASKRLITRWSFAFLLSGLLCSFQVAAHDYDDGYWRPPHHHHHHDYYGWQRLYYPPPSYYAPPPPRYVPVPPPRAVIGAPPVRLEVPLPGPYYGGWR